MGIDAAVIVRIAALAAQRDAQGEDLAEEIGMLHAAGALAAALPEAIGGVASWAGSPLEVAAVLERIGRASLPLGRLFEGHVNAAQLIGLLGSERLQAEVAARVRAGALLGVWGADGDEPVIAQRFGGGLALSGGKIFCSGLGLVELALVSARHDGQTLLVAIEAALPGRADNSGWRVSGMRATASGAYDVNGMTVAADAVLGAPDAYYIEPWFLGGMYRMCAVQCGGLDALIAAFVAHARQRGAAARSLLHYRIGSLLAQAELAHAATRQLAELIAAAGDPETIARCAVLTREGVERCIVEALRIVERAAGTAVHRETTLLSRTARDLSFYIRQGAIDDRLIAVGAAALM